MTKHISPRQPTHRLYVVKGDDQNARWTEVGAAWSNRDGQGFSLALDSIPLGSRIAMRAIAEREEGGQS